MHFLNHNTTEEDSSQLSKQLVNKTPLASEFLEFFRCSIGCHTCVCMYTLPQSPQAQGMHEFIIIVCTHNLVPSDSVMKSKVISHICTVPFEYCFVCQLFSISWQPAWFTVVTKFSVILYTIWGSVAQAFLLSAIDRWHRLLRRDWLNFQPI